MCLPLTLTSVEDLESDDGGNKEDTGFDPMHVYSARSSSSTFSIISLAFSTPLSSLWKVIRESLISLSKFKKKKDC